MAKGFLIGSNDFDDLFEAPYGNFTTTTFTGLNPTCTYIQRYNNTLPANPNYYDGAYRYFYGSDYFSAAPKGSIASNTRLATITTTGTWITVTKADGGVSINGTTYYNSSRGSYPINRVGLLLCAGGGGGASGYENTRKISAMTLTTGVGGGGGGGGAVALCTLWLDSYSYRIYIGAGGSKGSSSSGGSGGTSYLQLSNGTGLVTLTGGGGGAVGNSSSSQDNPPAGGSGGTVSTSYNGTYFQYNAGANGGPGGNGGAHIGSSSSWMTPSVSPGNGTSRSISGYINSISNSSASVSGSGSGGSAGTVRGGGGASAIGTASGNYGSGGYGSENTMRSSAGTYYTNSNYAGAQGVAYFYY